MTRLGWFVSTDTAMLGPIALKRDAVLVAHSKSGQLHRECNCGCGEPASKAVRLPAPSQMAKVVAAASSPRCAGPDCTETRNLKGDGESAYCEGCR